ncbi:hypothetical protein [Subtercola endophyticus]|uniref:hypothetical protein n=1 Tax=Subtercola endophyticus TaxID=2895559 RepID=UPI001E4EABD2|nr:hypothetical protein [Subtercola endophyticus]UFS58427.1 hypothetical protein LQ955_15680 [Subtercola endophyticus]
MPAGASIVWAAARSDEPLWFEHRVAVPELAESQTTTVDLQHWEVDGDLVMADSVFLSLQLVSELEGVVELLPHGFLAVDAITGEHRFAVDNDWLLTTAFVALDVVDEFDAPKLAVTMFLKGAVDAYQLEAHCFYNGARFAAASDVETRYTFTASDGSVVGQEVVAEFDAVRGWNNLSDSGWGGDWHLLDANDGQYEVKLLRDSRVARVVAFTVQGGRIVVPESGAETAAWGADSSAMRGVEFSPEFGAVIVLDASVHGDLDGDWSAGSSPVFYAVSAGPQASIDDVYAQRVERPKPSLAALDDETARALQAYLDRVERLLATWEADLIGADLIGAEGPFDYSQVLAAEAVLRERPGYDELAAAVHHVPDAHEVDRAFALSPSAGEPVDASSQPCTLGALRDRMLALFAAAETRVSAAAGAEDDELAPYRSLLSGDKLSLFEDHPANSFVYTTIGGRIMRTPEEVAEAEYWFFEGPTDVPSTATVEGVDVRVTVRGWRVRGWRFADDGIIVGAVEFSGVGQTAPSSAFRFAPPPTKT